MDVYRQKSIPVIFAELPLIRRSAPCPFVDSLDDNVRLQELQDVADGKRCVSALEYRSEFIIKCVLPDDILERKGCTHDELTWHSYYWKMWDIEKLLAGLEYRRAVSLSEAGIDPAYLQSIAERSSCMPLLEKTATMFDNKVCDFGKELKNGIREIERKLFAELDIDTLKGLRATSARAKTKPMRSRQVPRWLRDKILHRDKNRCVFRGASCNHTERIEVHHIIPVSIILKLNLDRRLELAEENLCATCFKCNRGKSDNLATEDINFYIDAFSDESHPNHGIILHLEAIRKLQAVSHSPPL